MAHKSELYDLLKRPIITEKSTMLASNNQYLFEVRKEANKVEVAKAFEMAFPGRKVTQVRMMTTPSKRRRVGRFSGQTGTGKKVILTVEGEPIEFFAGGGL